MTWEWYLSISAIVLIFIGALWPRKTDTREPMEFDDEA